MFLGLGMGNVPLRRAVGAFVLVLSVLVLSADGDWVWTSETGWMRKKYIPKASSEEQFEYATELYEKGNYQGAVTAFSMVRTFYPDSCFVEESGYMRGECLLRMGRNVTAYRLFEAFLEAYPDSSKRIDVIEKELAIGKLLLLGAKKDFIGGMKLVSDPEKGIEIIEKAIGHDPYHDRVPGALMLIGDSRFNIRWYSEAKRIYTRIVEDHPTSALRAEAEYKAVLCDASAVIKTAYDTSAAEKIEKKCKRLQAKNNGEMAKKAEELAETIRNRRARKEFEIAEFYRRTGRRTAAVTYYRLIVKNFEGTEWAGKAEKWLEKHSGG